MKRLSTFLIASAALVSVGSQAHAACSPVVTPITDGVSIDVAGCHLQIQNPPTVATGPGTEVVVRDPLTGEIGSDSGFITTAIGSAQTDILNLQSENAAQQTEIDANTATNSAQDSDIGDLQAENAAQQTEIDANTATNTAQDATLTDHENRITDNESDIGDLQTENANQQTEIDANTSGVATNAATNAAQQVSINANTAKNVQQDNRLDGHDTQLANHNARLNAHDDILAGHGETLEDHAKGLAIAMALPDAWLSDSKSFGIFGSVGGFDGETAIGFAAIGRIDETWSLNGKLGADTNFDHFGWQVGAGAQW